VSRGGDRGSTIVTSAAVVAVFLTCLFFAVQVLVNLYAVSTVRDAAHDAAQQVAMAGDSADEATVAAAEASADTSVHAQLDRYGKGTVHTYWSVDANEVALRVVLQAPTTTLFGLELPVPYRTIDTTAHVRREVPR